MFHQIRMFLFLLILSVGNAFAAVGESISATDGKEYRLNPNPDIVNLKPGESLVIKERDCRYEKIDWLYRKEICQEAVILTASDSGIAETGGEITDRAELRVEVIFCLAAMILMAIACLLFLSAGAAFALVALAAGVSYVAFASAFASVVLAAVDVDVAFAAALAALAFAVAVAVDEKEKKVFFIASLTFEGLMSWFLFLII